MSRDAATAQQVSEDGLRSAGASRDPAGSGEQHDVNHVRLRATVSTAPQRRSLPSGDEVVALGLAVRRPTGEIDAVPVQLGPAPPPGGRPRAGQVGRSILAAAERLDVGDRVTFSGRIQRRWWSAGGVRRSRIEVVASAIDPNTD